MNQISHYTNTVPLSGSCLNVPLKMLLKLKRWPVHRPPDPACPSLSTSLLSPCLLYPLRSHQNNHLNSLWSWDTLDWTNGNHSLPVCTRPPVLLERRKCWHNCYHNTRAIPSFNWAFTTTWRSSYSRRAPLPRLPHPSHILQTGCAHFMPSPPRKKEKPSRTTLLFPSPKLLAQMYSHASFVQFSWRQNPFSFQRPPRMPGIPSLFSKAFLLDLFTSLQSRPFLSHPISSSVHMHPYLS